MFHLKIIENIYPRKTRLSSKESRKFDQVQMRNLKRNIENFLRILFQKFSLEILVLLKFSKKLYKNSKNPIYMYSTSCYPRQPRENNITLFAAATLSLIPSSHSQPPNLLKATISSSCKIILKFWQNPGLNDKTFLLNINNNNKIAL